MALVCASRGYFIATRRFQDNSLYRLYPGTGAVVSNVNGPQVSVADFTAQGMTVIDTKNDCFKVALIDTGLNPGKTCSARPIQQEVPHGAQAHQDLYTHR